ncbi:hypothetical protein V5O48_012250 [Marasmius crinis-equi]|uniref:DUF6699 domain-containing protein n=1 Tax=Marasmius crinis-equi TaxID=585013 RepID=A0ABR3F3F0_9AGAR
MPSGALVLQISFPDIHFMHQIYVCASEGAKWVTVWDVFVAISTGLHQPPPKEVILQLSQTSGTGMRVKGRSERKGRDYVCWMDLLKEGSLFAGLRIIRFEAGKYVMAEVLLRQQ